MEAELLKSKVNIAHGIEEIKQFLLNPEAEQIELPLKHSFSEGVYIREMFMPHQVFMQGN